MTSQNVTQNTKSARVESDASSLSSLREVTRYIPDHIKFMLWGKAAGRCEFAGHNVPLWKSPITQEQVNIAEVAHIYPFSDNGPRGNEGIPKEKLNDLGNLMLVCPLCHAKMDQFKSGGRYTTELLVAMKDEHERRIEVVTATAPGMTSYVLHYGANIGHHSSPLKFADTALALFPERYPAEDRAIELGMIDSSLRDSSDSFWTVEAENLRTKFNQRVWERLVRGEVSHLSVFALAPQPLLILLGTLLVDISEAQVFQRHREPQQTWKWPADAVTPEFEIVEPGNRGAGTPALVLALSATVTKDRITRVLGEDAAIWMLTIPEPNNDFTKSRMQLSEFRTLLRKLLDRIKATHGQNTPLHIFPAASVSVGVELGRIRMPKADTPWKIYDQVNQRGGFIHALDISGGN
jgi:SMODS-associated and fused to various effectors sensor domain/HNH endonuclease